MSSHRTVIRRSRWTSSSVAFACTFCRKAFHRIRHYGLLASATRKANVARARDLLDAPMAPETREPAPPLDRPPLCRCCGGHMGVIEIIRGVAQPAAPPALPMSTG